MPSTATTFDLRDLVRRVCASSTAVDPSILAKEVGRQIDDADLREALDQALPAIVQNVISRRPVPTRESAAASATPPAPSAPRTGGAPAPRSWKVAAIRRYARELAQGYATGFGSGNYKQLGQFTAADCRSAAEMRRSLAAGNLNEATRFDNFARLLTEHRAGMIAELADSTLAPMFGGSK